MPESKLPRGPWRVTGCDEEPIEVVDARGERVLGGSANGLQAEPEVLRAVIGLPDLVEAARRLMSWVQVEGRSGLELPYSLDMCVAALGDALERIDD